MFENLFEYIYNSKQKLKKQLKICDKPLYPSGGICIGITKHLMHEDIYYVGTDTHSLCIGATRSGKSRNVVLQSIGLQALAEENIICSDPKGELMQYTLPFLERLGYKVFTLDFKNSLKSSRYNYLKPIIDYMKEDNIAKAIEATWDMVASLVPDGQHTEPIWQNGEASVIAGSIMAVVFDNMERPQFQNLANVYHFISEMCRTINGTMPLNQYINSLSEQHPARALMGISEVAPSKTRGSFFTSALTTLRLFTNPYVADMTMDSDFDAEKFDNNKSAVFLILPDEKTTYYSLASLFVTQFYEQLVKIADERGGQLKRRTNFNLDEFGNFTKIPSFTTKLTVGGGRLIRFHLHIQAINQLEEKYGKEMQPTILGNCQTWIYLRSDENDTRKMISEKLGTYTVATSSHSTQFNGSAFAPANLSASCNLTSRPLLTADEVGMINRPYSLIMSRAYPAIMIAPDISQCYFNDMYGLGDSEHNRKLREERESKRKSRTCIDNIPLWGIWNLYNGSLNIGGATPNF